MPTLATVCCHFNPCHYRRRVANYAEFRRGIERQGVQLLTVELAFGEDPFELTGGDIVRLRGGDVLWQKERLLQHGISLLLPEGHDAIAWLDTDIRFHDDAWMESVVRALDHDDVVQCYDLVYRHDSDGDWTLPGIVSARHLDSLHATQGYAWAARREWLQAYGLYQHAIVGGADMILDAACQFSSGAPRDTLETLSAFRHTSLAFRDHVFRWAARLRPTGVGYARNTIETMPHGARADRAYGERNRLIADFDPDRDVRIGAHGALEWSSDRPELHLGLRRYFESRREDS